MASGFRRGMAALDSIVYRATWIATGITMLLMFAVVMSVVVTRYLVDLPFFWGEEFSRYCMFYMIMLGSAVAIRETGHLRLTLFADMLPRRPRLVVDVVTDLVLLVVLAAIFWYGLDLATGDGMMRTPVLRWQFFWIWIAFPIGAALSIVMLITRHFSTLDLKD